MKAQRKTPQSTPLRCRGSVFGVLELDESETFVLLRRVVQRHVHFREIAKRDEGGAHERLSHVLREATHKERFRGG